MVVWNAIIGDFRYIIGSIILKMKPKSIVLQAAIVAALTLSPGCIQKIALNSIGVIMDNGFAVMNEERDLDIADKAIASDLKLLEAVLRSDPDNEHMLQLACQGYCGYALGFVEDDSAARAIVFYERGKQYGLKILRRHGFDPAENIDQAGFVAALSKLSKDDVPVVFWTAIGWGSTIYLDATNPATLADLPKIEAMMKWVVEKDPSYFYGGGHFFLGTLYGTTPKALGGKPDESRKHFEEAVRISGGKFLMTYVYYAKSYAVQTQNQELFDSLLTKIDTTSLDILPEARLSNAIAKQKAALLRGKESQLF